MRMKPYGYFAKDKKDANIMVVKFDKYDSFVAVCDLYCVNPDCSCKEVMLDFIEMVDDKIKDGLFYMNLDTSSWEVGKKHFHREDINCEELINDFLLNLDDETKAKFRNRLAEAKEYAKENPLDWFDDLDLEEGSCFGYSEVYGEKNADKFRFKYNETEYLVDDQYCTNPECKCNEVILTFVDIMSGRDAMEKFAVRMPFNTGKYKVEYNKNTSKAEMDEIIKYFKAHIDNDFGLIKSRYLQMKEFGKKRIKRKKQNGTEQRVVVSKAGRNDPCPCGSGKKFKKCCGIS